MNPPFAFAVALCLILNRQTTFVSANVIISEIAGKGSSNTCGDGKSDWIELYNNDANDPVNLAGYTLHDDKGVDDADAFTFPPDYAPLMPGEYRLICTMMGGNDTADVSPQFSIGGDDVITLVSNDGTTVITSVGPLPDTYNEFDITYAWDSDSLSVSSIDRPAENQSFYYTSTPTPRLPNILTQVGETADEIKQRFMRQNQQGIRFFGIDSQGIPVEDALEQVLDLHLTMLADDYDYMMKNKGFEVYLPFQTATLVTADSFANELLSLSSPGQIRTKGQSSLFVGTCAGTTTVPFQIEFDPLETLFGVERMYLRNHFMDPTYMRDWAMNRMLARFGLPHLRTRKLQFYINGDYIGFYDAMEAVDQEYVFARSFPSYNPFNFSLYKRKIESMGCGNYDPDVLAEAETRLDDPSKPPYSFERGSHRDPIPAYRGKIGLPFCMIEFAQKYFIQDVGDVATLYLKYNKNCGEMLVQESLVDRDLGTENWDTVMTTFINKYLVETVVSDNSDMDQEVDVESFLKTMAVLAFMLSEDSVLGTMNNYYMAQIGDGKGFKLISIDHNIGPAKGSCECESELNWSISRPTCGALELNPVVGPLLLKPELHARYIGYMREFTEQVAGVPAVWEEITNHAHAIHRFVRNDFWHSGSFRAQFSTDPADWKQGEVPFIMARVEDVRQQIEAIDQGTIPRGPHLPVKEASYETCADWRATEAPAVACYNGCLYDGCHMANWHIAHQCIEETGTCIHGTYDLRCRGVREGEQYPDMESPRTSTGLDTFCINPYGAFPVKASICPPPPPPDEDRYNFGGYNVAE